MAREPRSGLDPSFDVDAAPRVGMSGSLWPIAFGVVGALGLGTVVFLQLDGNRQRMAEAKAQPAAAPVQIVQPAPQPVAPVVVEQPPPAPMPEPEPILAAPPPPTPVAPGPTQAELDRLRAPALIIDLGEYKQPGSNPLGGNGSPIDPKALAGAVTPGQSAISQSMNADERFAQRFGVGDTLKPSKATAKIDLSHTIIEGSIVPAVLETAINSDLPGYVRAVVSRDVPSYDGSNVLVPRGSRLIGQYKSGVALGQSRTFVIWTRLIRPDGAAIELAAPATDGLGRGGLDGKVDTHFLQRFGGAILLTLLNIGVSAATDGADTAIVIAGARTGDIAGSEVSATQNISPTVKVPQGSPVRVFVNQDLDFSDVGAAPPSDAPAAGKPN
jgi:type IV secretion system protein VirB10